MPLSKRKTPVKTAEVDEQKMKRKHEKVISQLYKVNTTKYLQHFIERSCT
jgi:hypothetical protein